MTKNSFLVEVTFQQEVNKSCLLFILETKEISIYILKQRKLCNFNRRLKSHQVVSHQYNQTGLILLSVLNSVPKVSCLRGSLGFSAISPNFFLVGILWAQNILSWVFRGSRIFSGGYFVGNL